MIIKYMYTQFILNLIDYRTVIFSVLLFMYHRYIKPIIDNMTHKVNTAYFLLHFIFNAYVVYNSFSDMINILNNPYDIYLINSNLTFLIFILHLYHWFAYKDISLDEVIHHVLMIFIIIPLTFLCYTNLMHFTSFFVNGLPGGITYLLLVLKDYGLIDNLTEKKISVFLNLWIRAPGCVISSYICYINRELYLNYFSHSILGYIALIICIDAILWNGMYFLSTIIRSHEKLQKIK